MVILIAQVALLGFLGVAVATVGWAFVRRVRRGHRIPPASGEAAAFLRLRNGEVAPTPLPGWAD